MIIFNKFLFPPNANILEIPAEFTTAFYTRWQFTSSIMLLICLGILTWFYFFNHRKSLTLFWWVNIGGFILSFVFVFLYFRVFNYSKIGGFDLLQFLWTSLLSIFIGYNIYFWPILFVILALSLIKLEWNLRSMCKIPFRWWPCL